MIIPVEDTTAKAASCRLSMDAFDASTSSVGAKQAYAECVRVVYPVHDPVSVSTVKIAIAVVLLGAVVGGVLGFRSGELSDTVAGSLFGAVAGVAGLAIFAAIIFLFS